MNKPKAIHWFRQDLRLSDNPAFNDAAKNSSILPIYILDNENSKEFSMGAASRFWLHHSLTSLDKSLDKNLSIYYGNPLEIILDIVNRLNIEEIYWNRCYEPWRIKRDTHIKKELESHGIKVTTLNGSLLWEPWTIKKPDGTPYKVFTPFFRKGCLLSDEPRKPLPAPNNLDFLNDIKNFLEINDLGLLPLVRWDIEMKPFWNIGEDGAHKRLTEFLDNGIANYKNGRNFPAKPFVSKISPHIHFGEISPNQAWYAAKIKGNDASIDHFLSELGWREFSYTQLYFNPELPKKNLQSKFDQFPWDDNSNNLLAWQQGKTGIPMVDAGMRELWLTGAMHNRVRMVVGSFLVKHLLINWKEGEKFFRNCLLDYSEASNVAGWQWVAGSGADASPYFRIFNPILQGEKFDKEGEYVKKWIPELKNISKKFIHKPWELKGDKNFKLGRDYPFPLVKHEEARAKALISFKKI